LRVHSLILPTIAAFAVTAPAALADGGGAGVTTTPTTTPTTTTTTTTTAPPTPSSGGAGLDPSVSTVSTPLDPTVPGVDAKIIRGVAYAPAEAPLVVQEAIWAGNVIRKKPYWFGGGHGKFQDGGYDCSGSVSYVLHAAGMVKISMDSGTFMSWGQRGLGQWITVYTNPGHAFVEIAGIRLDTSAEGQSRPLAGTASGTGPRWRPLLKDTSGYTRRHPVGF
jgi:hypothetical protein